MLDKRKMGFANLRRNDGVIMFIVISIMTIMIVISMAFWVAVSSEMTDIKEDFSVEQTYQAAVSVNEWVYDYISAYMSVATSTNDMETECPLLYKILEEMSVGDTMSTGEIAGIENYGDCSIDISLVDVQEETNLKTLYFNIISTVNSGANSEKFTRNCVLEIVKVSVASSEPESGEEIFEFALSTSGETSQSTMQGYNVTEPIYFGNENIEWHSGLIASDFSIYGSFMTRSNFNFGSDPSSPIEINVGKNFHHENAGNIMPCGGKFRIGGYLLTNKQIEGETTFYILGEPHGSFSYAFNTVYSTFAGAPVFYINGNAKIDRSTVGCVFFINGDLDITSSGYQHGTFYVAGNVNVLSYDMINVGKFYYTGSYSGSTNSRTDSSGTMRNYTYFFERVTEFPWGGNKAWPEKDADINVAAFPGRDYESIQTARFNLRFATSELRRNEDGSIEYDANGDPISVGPKSVPDWNVKARLEELASEGDADAVEALYLIENNSISINGNAPQYTITQSGYINGGAAQQNTKTILIDTKAGASDPNDPETHKDIYIKLRAGASGAAFKWKAYNYHNLNIVVRGAGNVILFLDDGTAYNTSKFDEKLFIGHEGWLKYFGLANNADLNNWFNSNKTTVLSALGGVIHKNEICGKANCLYCTGLNPADFAAGDDFPGRFLIRQDDEVNLIEQFSTGGDAVYLHNNIFFIDNNNPTGSYFYNPNTIFFGYVYAPASDIILPNGGWTLVSGAFILGAVNSTNPISSTFSTQHIMPAEYYPFSRQALSRYVGVTPGGGGSVSYTEEYVPGSFGTNGYA